MAQVFAFSPILFPPFPVENISWLHDTMPQPHPMRPFQSHLATAGIFPFVDNHLSSVSEWSTVPIG